MGSGVRTGIPGERAKTRDVTIGMKDFYHQEAPHSYCLPTPSAHNPNLCPATAKHAFVDKQQ